MSSISGVAGPSANESNKGGGVGDGKAGLGWRKADGGVPGETEGERDMSSDGRGEQGRGGTFSSKKVDWTQESGGPRWQRERRETRGHMTSGY